MTITIPELMLIITNILGWSFMLHYKVLFSSRDYFLEQIFTDLEFRNKVFADYDKFAREHS